MRAGGEKGKKFLQTNISPYGITFMVYSYIYMYMYSATV